MSDARVYGVQYGGAIEWFREDPIRAVERFIEVVNDPNSPHPVTLNYRYLVDDQWLAEELTNRLEEDPQSIMRFFEPYSTRQVLYDLHTMWQDRQKINEWRRNNEV